ncbi:MAG TPA: hypothetical protein VHG51_09035, partial [Longimicrobiaceae bacterium]|nr:hypothetical protein [Longimicrobiaceae bacterium]
MSEMDRELEALRREEYGDSFPAVAAWLHRTADARERERTRPARGRPAFVPPAVRLAAVLAGVLLLAVACTLPVRRTETLGWYASVRLPGGAEEAQRRVAALPWARDALVMASPGPDGRTTLLLASLRGDPAQVRRWERDLAALPGAAGAATAPLRDVVSRPAYAAAGRALFGARFPGAAMGERERMGRVLALAREMAPGSVLVMEHASAAGPGDLLVYPGGDSAPVEVMVGDAPQVTLMLLRSGSGPEPDTTWIPLDAGRLRGAGDAERT